MTDPIEVSANEHEVVRVFAIDLPKDDVEAFATRDADGRWPLKDALGADTLDFERVEVFPVSDLAGMGLSGYLSQGLGVPEADVAAQRDRLDRVGGHVAVVTSSAFEGVAQTLHPEPPLRLVATLREAAPDTPPGPPLHSEGAAGVAGSPARADPVEPARHLSPTAISAIVLATLIVAALLFWAFSGVQQ